jgi:membrane associated rhomboid family serine protease
VTATLTGSPIMINPQFNPMIGPSTWVLINMGARYVACMHNLPEIQGSERVIHWPCPNTTSFSVAECQLSDLCGLGGVPNPNYDGNALQSPQPNQWFRFITPIFLHAGLIHIGFNLLLQLTIGKEMEMAIGSIRFFLVYMSAGIFGFIMGGNYAANGIASTGASGSLFGIIALTLLDLLYSWKERRNPVKDLMFIILDIVISFVLGLLPGLDNFSHIGGFLMGLCLGVCVLHSPNSLRKRLGNESSYSAVQNGSGQGPPPFLKNPVGFFKGRKPLWWAWWLVRAACLITIIVVFIVLLNNFYLYHNTCSWCKYLSCLVRSASILTRLGSTSPANLFNSPSITGASSATSTSRIHVTRKLVVLSWKGSRRRCNCTLDLYRSGCPGARKDGRRQIFGQHPVYA